MAFVYSMSCSTFLSSNVAWPAAAPRQHEREALKCLDCRTMENVGVVAPTQYSMISTEWHLLRCAGKELEGDGQTTFTK